MNVKIQVWHMIEIMRRDFSEHHQMLLTITENQIGMMERMSEIADQVGIDYPEVSVKNPITIEGDEGLSEPKTPVSEPPRQPLAIEARPGLRST